MRHLLSGLAIIFVVLLMCMTFPVSGQPPLATPEPIKNAYMAVSTNFDLLPVIDQYIKSYPDGDFSAYQVLFKAENLNEATPYSYMLMFDLNPATRYGFWAYLEAWGRVNRGKWAVTSTQYKYLPLVGGTRPGELSVSRWAGEQPTHVPTPKR